MSARAPLCRLSVWLAACALVALLTAPVLIAGDVDAHPGAAQHTCALCQVAANPATVTAAVAAPLPAPPEEIAFAPRVVAAPHSISLSGSSPRAPPV